MKIKLGILDKDERYTGRISAFFNANYSDKLEVYVFNTQESYQNFCKNKRIDVLLADPNAVSKDFNPPKNVAVAYLSDTQDVESIRNIRAFCRYQKAELIYKEIVSMYAGLETEETYKIGNNSSTIISFLGSSGGVGTTILSVACAKTLAKKGKSVILLSLEQNGVFNSLLSGEGNTTFSDALYSVKSKRANLGLKLTNMIRKDESGVFFIEPCSVLLDFFEMTKEDIVALLDAVDATGNYEYIIVDNGSFLSECHREVLKKSSEVFLVSDGMEISNAKLRRLVKAIELIDAQLEERMLSRTHIIYNRFGSMSRKLEMEQSINVFAEINKFSGGNVTQVHEQILAGNVFDSLDNSNDE